MYDLYSTNDRLGGVVSVALDLSGPRAVLPPTPGLPPLRRRLYEAAALLFGERGYGLVSVRDLASELGVTPAALYSHVASKEQLLFDVVLLGTEIQRDRMNEALLGAGSDPFVQIRALAHAHALAHLEYPSLARVVNREVRALTGEHLMQVRAVRRQAERFVIDVIERGIRLEVFETDSPRLTALAIAAMGIRTAEWLSREDLPDDDQIAQTFANYASCLLRKEQA
jgi:AcrR family transcriptional regulator